MRYQKDEAQPFSPVGEIRWGGSHSTQYWFWPQDQAIAMVLRNYRPYSEELMNELREPIFKAIREQR